MGIIDQTGHRPWPLPIGPWIQAQTWSVLLFTHWPVSRGLLQSKIPKGVMLDTYNDEAWIGITPFRISGARLRGAPPLPFLSQSNEVDVRTYVRVGEKPGVYYFSMDATNPLIETAARTFYHLPYRNAGIVLRETNAGIEFSSARRSENAPCAEFSVDYRATAPPYQATPGDLDHWLTERYCLYTVDSHGRLCRGEIHHLPWPLQEARAEIRKNTMAEPLGILLSDRTPLLHFSESIDSLIWPLARIKSGELD